MRGRISSNLRNYSSGSNLKKYFQLSKKAVNVPFESSERKSGTTYYASLNQKLKLNILFMPMFKRWPTIPVFVANKFVHARAV